MSPHVPSANKQPNAWGNLLGEARGRKQCNMGRSHLSRLDSLAIPRFRSLLRQSVWNHGVKHCAADDFAYTRIQPWTMVARVSGALPLCSAPTQRAAAAQEHMVLS